MVVSTMTVRVVDEARMIRTEHGGAEIARHGMRRMHLDPAIHADHLVRLIGDQPHVMADQTDGDFLGEPAQQTVKGPLYRRIQVRCGLVQEQ